MLLIGVSGAGKTTLSRFVAWMNGLSVYQIKVGIPLPNRSISNALRLSCSVYLGLGITYD